jgi:hypothetical protein
MIRQIGSLSGITLAVMSAAALAQPLPAPSGPPGANPVCQRLEAQLAALDRSSNDPGRAEQIRRYEDAANKQQAELDRTIAQQRRLGCDTSGFFQLFGASQNPQCGPLNNQIQQMRANLERISIDLQRLQAVGIDYERDGQRRAILAALGRNDCGPQYRAAATAVSQPRGFFDTLFGGNSQDSLFGPGQQGGGYRTICVRTCDGYYYPISFSTSPDHFRDDERTCQRMCPAAEVILFSHRNPGEDVSQAVSLSGRLYTELPNAFRYRQAVDPACSCKRPGETWADALKHLDDRSTIERGDILVTEDRAKALSQPRDAQGRPIKPAQPAPAKSAAPAETKPDAPAASPPTNSTSANSADKRTIRSVGPQLFPVR